MTTLLITGISGFLGWNLCQLARDRYTVLGAYHSQPVSPPGVQAFPLDLTHFESVQTLVSGLSPDGILHLAACSKPNFCERNPELSETVNVGATLHLASLAQQLDIPFVFTSTDLVFDGNAAPYFENDPVNPINLYGHQKARAEQGILSRYPSAAICRMPLMFGLPSPVAKSFIQDFIETLRRDQPLNLFTDEIRTPLSANYAAAGLLLAFERRLSGIWHLGGPDAISRYDFGKLLAAVLGLPTHNLVPGRQKDFSMAAARPPNVSSDSRKFYALGFQPPSLEEQLLELRPLLS
ncbi:MAG: SDR family oxidoreductase [Cyanobacteria bacterium P01_H01_bin.15]